VVSRSRAEDRAFGEREAVFSGGVGGSNNIAGRTLAASRSWLAEASISSIAPQFAPARANIRFMFQAMVTRLHSPRT